MKGQETQNTEKQKTSNKTLSGTEEKSAWEKAVETIAGDNKLMGVALKILLSPLTLLIGLGALVYCFVKIKSLNTEVEKLKTENKKLTEDKEEIEEEVHKVKRKYKKLKELLGTENESELSGLRAVPKNLIPLQPQKNKIYNTAFLD